VYFLYDFPEIEKADDDVPYRSVFSILPFEEAVTGCRDMPSGPALLTNRGDSCPSTALVFAFLPSVKDSLGSYERNVAVGAHP